jgi:hypothetical protein
LTRFYGMDLAAALDTGCRRMIALIRWLPPDASVWADTPAAWTVERELAASTVEMLGEVLRGVIAATGSKKLPKSIKVPRFVTPAAAKGKFDPYRFTAWLASAQPAGAA